MVRKEIAVNGRKIVYFEEGQGFPFLILHGWGPSADLSFFKLQRLLVAAGYRVILPSLPGVGGSSLPSPDWGVDEYLQCVSKFIDQINLEKFFLLGHSMGGTMAIGLAVSRPERIKALILLSPGIIPDVISWKWYIFSSGYQIFLIVLRTGKVLVRAALFGARLIRLERAIRKAMSWSNKLLPLYKFLFGREKMMSDIFKRIIVTEDIISYLPRVERPVLVVWGENDFNFYLGFLGARFVGRLPDYEIKIVPETSHNLHNEAPEEIAEMILNFIKKLEGKEL